MKKLALLTMCMIVLSAAAYSQPRPVGNEKAAVKPAPETFEAKYEGGMFGYNDDVAGSLKFDDANLRIVFRGKEQKELFSLPYDAFLMIYPQSQKVQTTTGKVVQYVPYASIFSGFMKEKRRYLVVQFDDPDLDAKGVVNFRLANKELLDSVVQTLGEKAKLSQRGDAYYKPKAVKIDPN